ncbi:FAD binding domain-containing protein [Apodospora peruviana]|uniref:FAD binding domain-containing protein n=1 Tax=Apodospora peruviana TaxID=516989 RepID=A0AAE0IK25_9PEZI|nr:FAD binding domain-containing protein [Apodospora peruviana]
MHDCDVLIVGAGPVGTVLALELALQNISFRIIDKSPVRSDKSRALVVQPRTLELLNRHGDVHKLSARGQLTYAARSYVDKKPVTTLRFDDVGPVDTEFPLPLMVSQAETELFLDDCLAKFGAAVERPIAARSIVQDDTGVTATLEGPDGVNEIIRSRYVVGCDGAHSVVRHAAVNLTFEGAAYPQDFILCDAYLCDSNIPLVHFSVYFGNGMLAILPMANGLVRLVGSGNLREIPVGKDPTLDQVQALLTDFTPLGSGTLYDPIWLTRFRLHHRGVKKYRDGRLFVAGDAAHIHSPAGGQGMNTGIQDAINLGWKLASVLQGTDQIFSFSSSMQYLFIRLRNFVLPWVLPWLVSSQSRRRRMYDFVSEFKITYRNSPIVGTAEDFGGPVAGGDRLPDGSLKENTTLPGGEEETTRVHHLCRGWGYHVLLFAGTGEGKAATRVAILDEVRNKTQVLLKGDIKTHIIHVSGNSPSSGADSDPEYMDVHAAVHAQFGFSKEPGYVFVRPDGYIAHIGTLSKSDELFKFWQKFFG